MVVGQEGWRLRVRKAMEGLGFRVRGIEGSKL